MYAVIAIDYDDNFIIKTVKKDIETEQEAKELVEHCQKENKDYYDKCNEAENEEEFLTADQLGTSDAIKYRAYVDRYIRDKNLRRDSVPKPKYLSCEFHII